jgi:hypothetical protein
MYISSSDEENETNTSNDDVCLICWLPSENNNFIESLSNHPYIIKICNCNPKIHTDCLNKWIGQNPSCPICRKILTINNTDIDNYIDIYIDNNNTNILTKLFICCYLSFYLNNINYYINCIKCILIFFKLCCYLCLVNILCIYIYNIYIIIDEIELNDNYYSNGTNGTNGN